MGGGGVLRISSKGDDRRIFLGLIFLIRGFLRIGVFLGWLDLSRDFWGVFKTISLLRGSVRVSWLRSSANKVQPNLFCGCFNIG